MGTPKHKVKLSPKLQLGVGRTTGSGSLMKYASMMFLVISAVLAIRAGYMVINGPEALESPKNPQVLGAQDTPETAATLFREHVVQKGETVFSIGQEYGIQWTTLATLNSLKAPFALKVGQTLKIPTQ